MVNEEEAKVADDSVPECYEDYILGNQALDEAYREALDKDK